MNSLRLVCAAVIAAAFSTACATSFTGSAHVEDGRNGCERKCKNSGMEVAGMVYMGEYSDACICSVPGQTGKAKLHVIEGGAAVAGGATGVIMQMRRQQEQNRHASY